MLLTSITNSYELLYAASQTAKIQGLSNNQLNTQRLELIRVSENAQTMSTQAGLTMAADAEFDETLYDVIYLPALWRNPRPIVKRNQALLQWLRYQYEHGAIINAVGTGVCFIAETGLLDHKPATTHWYYLEQFAQDYPNINLKRQHFITAAGTLFCAASINALTDLTIHHIHRLFNKDVAQRIERHFSHEIRKSFEKISYFEQQSTNHPDEAILQAQLWIESNLNKPITIDFLAKKIGMSKRNFMRRFKAATNLTPVKFIQQSRMNVAQDLLQNSNLTIAEIAYRLGISDVSYFSKVFKTQTSITPKQYRATVRAKLFNTTLE